MTNDMELKRSWPYGKPQTGPFVYDRQQMEEFALRPWHTCQDWLTPTGRLLRRIEPEQFARFLEEAIAKFRDLIANYPDCADRYQGWLSEAESLRPLCKAKTKS